MEYSPSSVVESACNILEIELDKKQANLMKVGISSSWQLESMKTNYQGETIHTASNILEIFFSLGCPSILELKIARIYLSKMFLLEFVVITSLWLMPRVLYVFAACG